MFVQITDLTSGTKDPAIKLTCGKIATMCRRSRLRRKTSSLYIYLWVQPPTVSVDAVVSVIPHSVKMKPDGQNTVLLQTAKAWVEGPSGRMLTRRR